MNEPLTEPPHPATRVTATPPPPPQRRSSPVPRPPKRIGSFGRGVWLLFGSVMALGAVGWGSANAVSLIAHEEWDEQASYAAADLTGIEVDNRDGRIDIRGADVDEVAVQLRVSRGLRRTGISDEVVDGVLRLRSTCPVVFADWCSVDYDIVVPRELDLTIDTNNGGIHVTDYDGVLVAGSDNGAIELIDVSGDVTADADNGSVTGSDLAGRVTASSDHGNIDLSFAGAPDVVVATTDHGNVDVALPAVDGGYDVRTDGDGDPDVDVLDDPASDRPVELETDHGSISVRDRG